MLCGACIYISIWPPTCIYKAILFVIAIGMCNRCSRTLRGKCSVLLYALSSVYMVLEWKLRCNIQHTQHITLSCFFVYQRMLGYVYIRGEHRCMESFRIKKGAKGLKKFAIFFVSSSVRGSMLYQ